MCSAAIWNRLQNPISAQVLDWKKWSATITSSKSQKVWISKVSWQKWEEACLCQIVCLHTNHRYLFLSFLLIRKLNTRQHQPYTNLIACSMYIHFCVCIAVVYIFICKHIFFWTSFQKGFPSASSIAKACSYLLLSSDLKKKAVLPANKSPGILAAKRIPGFE